MPYKSTNKINTKTTRIIYPILLLLMLFVLQTNSQSDCAKRPLPTNISLKANESIIINLDEYFDGSNLTFKVTPNNSFSAIEPTYQCSAAGNQRIGNIISTRYFLLKTQEVIAALAQSPFTQGSFTFYFFQIQQSKVTTLNLPKENIALCKHFTIKMINSTHFAPTIECNYTASKPNKLMRVLMSTIGQIGSPYADWQIKLAPLYANYPQPIVRLELVDDILIRGVFTPTNSYIQYWLWNEEVHQILGIIDKTFLDLKNFNIKSMKAYGRFLIILDYQSGLHILRLHPTNKLQRIARISFPFYEQFEYNTLTGALYLAKKGKIISTLLNPNNHTIAVTGEGFNIYKYENIHKMLVTDSAVVALSDTAINIFRRSGTSTDSRHYSLYQVANAQMIYTRLIADGFTVLLLQNNGNFLQVSSCRIRAPTLKLVTPRISIQTTVTATSILDKQQSACTLNFTLQPQITNLDDIYESGYRVDNEVVYANQQGEGSIELSKYGLGRDLTYSIKTVMNSVLQSETKIKKALPLNCTFDQGSIRPGGKIILLNSWENVVIAQFSIDNSLKYYVCSMKKCSLAVEFFGFSRINDLSHETLQKGKNGSEILQALTFQSNETITVFVHKLSVDNSANEITNNSICQITFNTTSNQLWDITQIQIYNNLLYLVMPFRKQIRIYDLRQAQQMECPNVLNLNTNTCSWGYFSPQSIHFNRAAKGSFLHQNFLIKQWDEILTVRLQSRNTLQPFLVTKNTIKLIVNYTLIYTAPYLLAFDMNSNRTYTYYFDDENIIQYLREIPMRGNRFKSLIDGRKDFGGLLQSKHLQLIMDNQLTMQTVSIIYKIDQLISGAIQYQSYAINADEKVTWVYVENQWHLLRLTLQNNSTSAELACKGNITYLNPSIQLVFGRTPSTFEEYSQNVTLTLYTADKIKLHQFKVSLSNVGDSIKRGYGFPSRGDTIDAKPLITIDDKKWFTGSVFDYEFDCPDCGTRIIFKQKVTLEDREPLPVHTNNFWMERQGKTVKLLMGSFLVELRYNYSVWPFPEANNVTYGAVRATSLTANGGNCLQVVPSRRQFQVIALCQKVYEDDMRVFYLSLISTASQKGFVVTESMLNFEGDDQPKLIFKNDIIIAYTSQVAYIMGLWEVQEELQFIELDTIDREDISGHICSIDLTFNTTLQTSLITDILFSMVVTECSSNVYFTSFVIYMEKNEFVDEHGIKRVVQVPNLHVSNAQDINLIAKFGQNHIQIPSEATVVQTITQRLDSESLSILAIYDKFNSYEFILSISKSGVAYNIKISRVFYKYGNYQAVSAQKADYLAIKYKSRLLGREERYGLFDNIAANESKAMKEYYMFSGYSMQNSGGDDHEIPWLFQGHTIIHTNGDFLEVINVTNLLRGYINRLTPDGFIPQSDPLYTQKIQITANNIASARSAVLILKAIDKFQLSAWQITLIVIGSIIFIIGSFFGLRFAIRKYKQYKKMVPLLQDSRLEDAVLQHDEEQRMSGRINLSIRGSIEPSQI